MIPPEQPENQPPASQPAFGFPPPGSVPPGYPPPGILPPPGYMPPPGMPMYPQGGYVPMVPIVQPVPPAQGSLIQAWFSLATHPSRANFAAWSQITTRNWIIGSIAAGAGIYLLLIGVIAGLILTILNRVPSGNAASLPAVSIIGMVIGTAVVLTGVNYLLQVVAQAFGQALFMSQPTYGALKARFVRALRPIALAQVGMTSVLFVLGTIASIIAYFVIAPSVGTTNGATVGFTILTVFGLYALFLIPYTVYGIMLQVQAGSVGSGFSRWAVFGINLLSGFVLGFVVNVITQVLSGILRLSISGH